MAVKKKVLKSRRKADNMDLPSRLRKVRNAITDSNEETLMSDDLNNETATNEDEPKRRVKKKTTAKKASPKAKVKAAVKKKAAAKKAAPKKKAPAKRVEAEVDPNVVTLREICEELGADPMAARRKLRNDESISRTDARWEWKRNSREHKKVVSLLS